jgi:hypothetical protein
MASQSQSSNWLLRYIRVQKASDAQVTAALRDALDSVDTAMRRLEGKPGVGAATRRAQLLGNHGEISKALSILYNKLGDIIREGQSNAAEQASLAEWNDARKIYSVILDDAKKRAVLEQSLQQSARRNVQTMMTRVLQTQQPLSKRIYNSRGNSKAMISRVINQHLARGSSVEELARDVRKFFNPEVPGGVNFAARRLARTEINNAFHAQAIADMQDRPWVNQSRWHLSGSHPKSRPDQCNVYASTGLFPVDHIPKKPHPGCLCYITPDLPDVNTVLNEYLAGNYNSWIAEHTDDGLRYSA